MSIKIKACKPENKRYGIYFREWWNTNITTEKEYLNVYWLRGTDLMGYTIKESYEYFDSLPNVEESAFLYNEIYQSTPRPTVIEKYKDKHDNTIPKHHLFEGDSRFWGYAILDFQECKILSIHGDLKNEYPWNSKKKSYDHLELLDILFRKPGEIPDNYKWDEGEYLGWLQFRWGNGLNAIGKKEEVRKSKNPKLPEENYPEIPLDNSDLEDKFSKDIEKERRMRKLNHW